VLGFLPAAVETTRVFEDPGFRRAFLEGYALYVDASTSAPGEIAGLAASLGPAGERLLDAPILGRPGSVGSWTMPVGGSPAAFAAALPALEPIASRVFHVGKLGSGHSMKLLN